MCDVVVGEVLFVYADSYGLWFCGDLEECVGDLSVDFVVFF